MAIYEDFDLDITTGTEKKEDGAARIDTNMNCYTDYATCETNCSAETCTGVRTRPCDR